MSALIGVCIYLFWQSAPSAAVPNNTQWASLVYNRTNGRIGPGQTYSIKWEYHRKNLPVIVLRKASQWSQVKDMDGDVIWMHNSVLRERKTALVIGTTPISLFGKGRKKNRPIARLQPGVLVRILTCTPTRCQIRVQDKTGWIDAQALWGPTMPTNVQKP